MRHSLRHHRPAEELADALAVLAGDVTPRVKGECEATGWLGYEGLAYALEMSRRMHDATGHNGGCFDTVQGVLMAAKVAELPLDRCRSRSDVAALTLAYLNAGRRTLEGQVTA